MQPQNELTQENDIPPFLTLYSFSAFTIQTHKISYYFVLEVENKNISFLIIIMHIDNWLLNASQKVQKFEYFGLGS